MLGSLQTVDVFFINYTCIVFTAFMPGCALVCTVLYTGVFPVLCLFCTPVSLRVLNQMFKLIILSTAESGIPSNTCPFPGTTKNTHLFFTFLNLMWTMHIPSCMMCILLYVFSFMFPFTPPFQLFFTHVFEQFWNMYSGMTLPPLPVLILYRISNEVSPTCISKCAVISDCILFKYNELILTIFFVFYWESGPISISTSCTM